MQTWPGQGQIHMEASDQPHGRGKDGHPDEGQGRHPHADTTADTTADGSGDNEPMFSASTASERMGFLLLPQFSMMAFFSAVEPLRIANRIAGRPLYEWTVIGLSGDPVTASNGMTLMVDHAIDQVRHLPSLAVCSGFDPEQWIGRGLSAWLNRLDQGGCRIGALDTGAVVLAEAGLLAGETVTLHWETLPAFNERYPTIRTCDELFLLGQRRFFCAGGAAAMDMTLEMIARQHGMALAVDVSEQLIHDRLRSRTDQQRMSLVRRLGTHQPRLIDAVSLMESHLEAPLELAEIARRSQISLRQLQRLFADELGESPTGYYLGLRLNRAASLLKDTDLDVLAIGLSCGFGSASSFSRAFRRHYGCSPLSYRRQDESS